MTNIHSDIKALFFDVGGTVFDWKNTAISCIEQRSLTTGIAVDAEAFANDWRVAMFKARAEVAQGELPWMNADGMHLLALERLIPQHPILASCDLGELVTDTWHNLQAFTGAASAIGGLRSKYTVVVLTILSWQGIVASSKKASVVWDGVLSCEFLGYYKPSKQAYIAGMKLLGVSPEQAMMVAAHEGDLAAAQSAGMKTALVQVPVADVVNEGFGRAEGAGFDYHAQSFGELCQLLGVASESSQS